MITGLLSVETNKVFDNTNEYDLWINKFRIVGKKHTYTQMYFQVHSTVPWKELIDSGKGIIRQENLSVMLKRTKTKGWNCKIRLLLGPKVDKASLKAYEEELRDVHKISLNDFELRKKIEKEKETEAFCIVIYAVESKAEMIDSKLREMVFMNFDNLRYYSCINRSAEEKMDALVLNRLIGMKMKYETLKGVKMREKVKLKGVEMTLQKALSLARVNGVAIFQVVEQGYGVRDDDAYVYYYPE